MAAAVEDRDERHVRVEDMDWRTAEMGDLAERKDPEDPREREARVRCARDNRNSSMAGTRLAARSSTSMTANGSPAA